MSRRRPARTYDEVAATKTMLGRTEACFDLKPKRLAAGTGKILGWLVKEKEIAPHIPVWERPKREDAVFSTSDFKWDRRRGVYICPNGKQLRTSGTVHLDGRQRYRARKRDCDVCPLRPQCCPKESPRHVGRDVHEDARDVARRKMKTKAFLKSRDQCKSVEMRFAHLKTHHGFERLRLRGLSGARALAEASHSQLVPIAAVEMKRAVERDEATVVRAWSRSTRSLTS